MKKFILALLIFVTVLTGAYSELQPKSTGFYVYLNKSGTDEIRFSDTDNPDGSMISTHVFPLITVTEPGESSNDTRTVTSVIYLHWIHQSGFTGIKVELSFVAKETDNAKTESGYMLYKENSTDETGLNYYVEFEFKNEASLSSEDKLGKITFNNTAPESGTQGSDLVQKAAAGARYRSFSLDNSTYESPLKITMTVKAPYEYIGSTTDADNNVIYTYRQYWMEAQYGGYIKAVITDGN